MVTRLEIEERRQRRARQESRDGAVLAAASVGLGLGQLLLIRELEARLPRRPAVTIEGVVFLAYMALVAWLLWRLRRRSRLARLVCPRCGASLDELSERVALATGKCDRCGGEVVA
jgi:hypothetical protein